MRETVRRSPGMHLLVEYNPQALRAAATTPEAFLHLLEEIGLAPRPSETTGNWERPPDLPTWMSTVICYAPA